MSPSYVDSDGIQHDHMTFSEALELVHELASSNILNEGQTGGDVVLQAEQARQTEAVDMLHDLVVNYSDQIDGSFQPPERAAERPERREKLSADADMTIPSNYLRLCLDLASQAYDPEMADEDVALADEIRQQGQALDLGWDLVDLHGPELDLSITSIPAPRA
ncbi:hypothetical protein PQI07_31000 [Methylobacterium sp. 092160098-2]|uniref:hypothetical protein n=1 Tax=Methylobacterium sp. 092160098-2 TaxID=3025129 RepID=UPI002381CC5D|nr:hypothetical protein [Methylobacterium sp. 092160098-2]MDE4915073.1 hypothetical protein [Methylobacterium sp. 092160098-2]